MPSYSVAEAKNTLPRLIDRAIAGEEVIITRHGLIVAEVRARKPVDHAARRALHAQLAAETLALPPTGIASVELLREMGDETPW